MRLPQQFMSNITIEIYQEKHFDVWNEFVLESKNGTFLFHRNFMDYHKALFQDFSLMIYNKSKLVAMLPAHIQDDSVHSHEGLTYGGFVVGKNVRTTLFFEVIKTTLKFLHQNGYGELFLKEIPYFFHEFPTDELKYTAFITNAGLMRRDFFSVIDLRKPIVCSHSVKNVVISCSKKGYSYKKCKLWEEFWTNILEPELDKKYKTKPVHALKEIMLLAERFPDNINFYGIFKGEELVGGSVLFISGNTVHCQYIAGKSAEKKEGVLHFLHYNLIHNDFKNYHYFDFGMSNLELGRKVNKGLLFWKESFGASAVAQDFYRINTSNYHFLESVYL